MRPRPRISKGDDGWLLAIPGYEDQRCASWEVAVLAIAWTRSRSGICARGHVSGDHFVIDAVPHPCGILVESFAGWSTAIEDADRTSREASARLVARRS